MVALKSLVLAHNFIESIPNNCFETLSKIEYIDLSYNRIKSINDIFRWPNLSRLRWLYLAGNQIQYIKPNAFSTLKSLKGLDLSDNKLTSIELDWYVGIKTKTVPFLQYMNISYNYIDDLPNTFFTYLKYNILDVSNNHLTYAPIEMQDNIRIGTINIDGNPWQCICLSKLEEVLTANNVNFINEVSLYRTGKKPVCINRLKNNCYTSIADIRLQRIPSIYEHRVRLKQEPNYNYRFYSKY